MSAVRPSRLIDLGARLADTADSALMLTGVITWVWVLAKIPDWWALHVKPHLQMLRWGLRWEMVEPGDEKKPPFLFEE